MGGQVMFITTTWIECVFLKGVVQEYSPVSPSSALTMLSLYSRVESLIGPWAQPCIIMSRLQSVTLASPVDTCHWSPGELTTRACPPS